MPSDSTPMVETRLRTTSLGSTRSWFDKTKDGNSRLGLTAAVCSRDTSLPAGLFNQCGEVLSVGIFLPTTYLERIIAPLSEARANDSNETLARLAPEPEPEHKSGPEPS